MPNERDWIDELAERMMPQIARDLGADFFPACVINSVATHFRAALRERCEALAKQIEKDGRMFYPIEPKAGGNELPCFNSYNEIAAALRGLAGGNHGAE